MCELEVLLDLFVFLCIYCFGIINMCVLIKIFSDKYGVYVVELNNGFKVCIGCKYCLVLIEFMVGFLLVVNEVCLFGMEVV